MGGSSSPGRAEAFWHQRKVGRQSISSGASLAGASSTVEGTELMLPRDDLQAGGGHQPPPPAQLGTRQHTSVTSAVEALSPVMWTLNTEGQPLRQAVHCWVGHKSQQIVPQCPGWTVSVEGLSQEASVGERSAGIVAKEDFFTEGFEGNHASGLQENSP